MIHSLLFALTLTRFVEPTHDKEPATVCALVQGIDPTKDSVQVRVILQIDARYWTTSANSVPHGATSVRVPLYAVHTPDTPVSLEARDGIAFQPSTWSPWTREAACCDPALGDLCAKVPYPICGGSLP